MHNSLIRQLAHRVRQGVDASTVDGPAGISALARLATTFKGVRSGADRQNRSATCILQATGKLDRAGALARGNGALGNAFGALRINGKEPRAALYRRMLL